MIVAERKASTLFPERRGKRRKLEPEINLTLPYCHHFFVFNGICSQCRSKVDDQQDECDSDYFPEWLQLSLADVAFMKEQSSRYWCLERRKLILVLDLDHTLLHSRRVSDLREEEKYLIQEVDSRDDLWRITQADSYDYLVKLRPFVRQFLQKASNSFLLYVYTMGNDEYAKAVMKLLDPHQIYFGDRFITREESPLKKNLHLVLAEERDVIIVDDTSKVWPEHQRNLLQIKQYNFFGMKMNKYSNSRSYAEVKADESEEKGPLAKVLTFLNGVHTEFFKDGYEDRFHARDVTRLLHAPRFPLP